MLHGVRARLGHRDRECGAVVVGATLCCDPPPDQVPDGRQLLRLRRDVDLHQLVESDRPHGEHGDVVGNLDALGETLDDRAALEVGLVRSGDRSFDQRGLAIREGAAAALDQAIRVEQQGLARRQRDPLLVIDLRDACAEGGPPASDRNLAPPSASIRSG